MSVHALDELNSGVSCAMAAVIWTVQLVVYPAFTSIDRERFQSWHRGYTGAITWIVAPLMLVQTGAVAGLLFLRRPDAWNVSEAACVAIAWLTTWFVSVPLHQALQRDVDPSAMSRLVRTNWIRTIAWSVAVPAAVMAGH